MGSVDRVTSHDVGLDSDSGAFGFLGVVVVVVGSSEEGGPLAFAALLFDLDADFVTLLFDLAATSLALLELCFERVETRVVGAMARRGPRMVLDVTTYGLYESNSYV
jgi:hypothetical protein